MKLIALFLYIKVQSRTFVFTCFWYADKSDAQVTTEMDNKAASLFPQGIHFCFKIQSDGMQEKTIVLCKLWKNACYNLFKPKISSQYKTSSNSSKHRRPQS